MSSNITCMWTHLLPFKMDKYLCPSLTIKLNHSPWTESPTWLSYFFPHFLTHLAKDKQLEKRLSPLPPYCTSLCFFNHWARIKSKWKGLLALLTPAEPHVGLESSCQSDYAQLYFHIIHSYKIMGYNSSYFISLLSCHLFKKIKAIWMINIQKS